MSGTAGGRDHSIAYRDGNVLRVAIVGRVTGAAIGGFEELLQRAITEPAPYVVLFDRRAMTAPTPEGRAALQRWGTRLMPQVAATCTGWADVYDERRAASLRAAAARAASEADDHGSDGGDPGGYPHRLFDDLASAEGWLAGLLETPRIPVPPRKEPT